MHAKQFTACALAAMLTLSPVSTLAVHAEEDAALQPLLYASFDDGTASDASGAGNHGTITRDEQFGTVEFVDGINGGKALHIVNDSKHRKKNPAANYVDFGSNLKVGTNDFSVSLWYKTDAEGVSEGDTANDDHGGNDVSLFGNKDYSSGTNPGLTLGNFSAETPADLRVNFVAKKGTRVEISKVYVCDDNWHHLAATFDRDDTMNVYVDGSLYGTKSISEFKDLSLDVNGQNFVLGADGVHTYGTPGATVDELRMYQNELSADQVAALYEQDKPEVPEVDPLTLNVTFDDETANDSSAYQTNGTIVGDVQFVDGVKGKAVKISNDSDHRKGNPAEQYITFGKQEGVTFGADDFTLAFWHKSEGHGASDSAIIGNKDYTSGSNIGLAVGNYHAPNVNSIDDIRMNISGKQGKRVELKQISANNDQWHYVVSSFDRDGNMTVYMDGRKVGAVNMADHAGTSVDAGEFVLGADGYFTYGADGCLLDEVRIYKKALSEAECTDLYRASALFLKLNEMKQKIEIAGTTEYPQAAIDAFKTTLNNIETLAGTADEETAAALCTELENAYAALQAQANEPILTFDVLSDIHLRDSDSSRAATFINGLKDITANHADSDALVTLGDNVSFGYDNNSRTQYFDLIEQYVDWIPNKVITLGNHDVRKNDSSSSTGFSSNYEVAYKAYMEDNRQYRDDPESDKIYFDKWINGYHFIALNTEDGLKDCIHMTDEQLTWFEQKLGEDENGNANAADPSKPVFVAVHQALNDTHPRANAYGGFTKDPELMERVYQILEKHPQAIVMSGHIHNGFGIATTMDRTYGTMIDVPSYNEIENGVTQNGTGYQVDVYEDRVHFRARNYVTSTWMPEYDLILSAPSLPSAVAQAEAKEETDYTPETWNTFTEALSSADGLLNSANETARLDVFAAAQNLNNAMNALAPIPEPVVKDALLELYNANKDKAESDYTADSWAAFKTALDEAKLILESETATQDDVDNAYKNLETAVNGLTAAEPAPEPIVKENLQKLYNDNKDKKESDYTKETWAVFRTALDEAKLVLESETATQDDVNDAFSALEKAINGLKKAETKPDPDSKPDPKPDPKPENPDKKPSADKGNNADKAPVTGDTATIPLTILTLLLSGVAIISVRTAKKEN